MFTHDAADNLTFMLIVLWSAAGEARAATARDRVRIAGVPRRFPSHD